MGAYERDGEDILLEKALANKNLSGTGPPSPEDPVPGPTVKASHAVVLELPPPKGISLDRGLVRQIGNKVGNFDLPTGKPGPGNPRGGVPGRAVPGKGAVPVVACSR
jgi:hypothetical protein